LANTVEFTKPKQILNKLFLHIILIVFCVNFSFSQPLYEHRLDKNKWNNIKEGIRHNTEKNGGNSEWTFDDKNKYKTWKKNFNKGGNANSFKPKHISKPKLRVNPKFNFGSLKGLSVIGWIILFLLAAGIIYLIIKYILDSNSGKTKVKPVNYINEDVAPSEIPLTELQRLLKQALEKEDYRKATRIYYLFILKDLSAKQWIKWGKEKTNMHYLYEMQKQSLYKEFSKIVTYFEIVWYGKRHLNKQQFEIIQPSFIHLLNQLGIE